MKKMWLIKGDINTTFYGEEPDEDTMREALMQAMINSDYDSISNIESESEECAEWGKHYNEIAFCLDNKGLLSCTDFTIADYEERMEKIDEARYIQKMLEKVGWDFDDEEFAEDLSNILRDF